MQAMNRQSHIPTENHASRSVVCAMLTLLILAGAGRAEPPGFVHEQLVVKLKPKVKESVAQSLFKKHGAREQEALSQINVRVIQVPAARLAKVMNALKRNRHVESAEPDWLLTPDATPNDPYYSQQWQLPKIGAPAAWDMTTGSSMVTVAILDSGVEGANPDLAPLLVPGWNFYDNNSNTSDVTGHGTAVAGAAAANGNDGVGVAGVAWNCRIMPLRIAGTNGLASSSAVASALTWASDNGARVANISYANVTKVTAVISAAQYFQSRGGVVTASAGNLATFDPTPDNAHFLLVSATDSNDALASWSNTGNNVDLAAPGVSIGTTVRGGVYGYASGTSFSAPLVAGVAALVISANPALSGAQVQSVLRQSADDLGAPGWDPSYGNGRVNAAGALTAALASVPVESTPPVVNIIGPSSASTISGTVPVSITATDNVSVVQVEWYLDGAQVGVSGVAPAVFSWDTRASVNGSHGLQARARDAAGNVGLSAIVNVNVQNATADTVAPTVALLSPASGTTVSGVASVQVTATDNVGVTQLEWYLDGVLKGTGPGGSLSFSWSTAGTSNGTHTLQTRALDAAGNVGTSAPLSVVVQNGADTIAPTVRITSPVSGTTISRSAKTTRVYATATDNAAVTRVELKADGKLVASSTSANPVFSWNTSKVTVGTHTLQTFAYDAAGNVGASAVCTVQK